MRRRIAQAGLGFEELPLRLGHERPGTDESEVDNETADAEEDDDLRRDFSPDVAGQEGRYRDPCQSGRSQCADLLAHRKQGVVAPSGVLDLGRADELAALVDDLDRPLEQPLQIGGQLCLAEVSEILQLCVHGVLPSSMFLTQ